MMNKEDIQRLRQELEAEILAGATTDELCEWMYTRAFGREDLFEVVRLLIEDLKLRPTRMV